MQPNSYIGTYILVFQASEKNVVPSKLEHDSCFVGTNIRDMKAFFAFNMILKRNAVRAQGRSS